MGSYGIGLDRLMAVIVELHHDEHGIVWPESVAPFDVHLMTIGKGEEPREVSDRLYAELGAAGFDVYFDDRVASAGVKFKDADLIGIPVRVAVGARGLAQGGVEVKRRGADERRLVAVEQLVGELQVR
jgi:prolyl-tRNA synthetase